MFVSKRSTEPRKNIQSNSAGRSDLFHEIDFVLFCFVVVSRGSDHFHGKADR